MSQHCRAVFFDAGHTLLQVREPVGATYARVAEPYGLIADPEQLDRTFREVWDERQDAFNEGTSPELEYRWWRDIVAETFGRAGHPEASEEAFDAYFEELYDLYSTPGAWRVFEDVIPTLSGLREAGIRCAVVSNWDPRLPVLLESVGLTPWFELVVTSAQAGYRKPDRRIFHIALEKLRVDPQHVVHVGDSYEDDVVGAKNAGIRPVLIDRDERSDGRCERVCDLRQLLALCSVSGG